MTDAIVTTQARAQRAHHELRSANRPNAITKQYNAAGSKLKNTRHPRVPRSAPWKMRRKCTWPPFVGLGQRGPCTCYNEKRAMAIGVDLCKWQLDSQVVKIDL